MKCPYCDAENRDGVRYCSNCGKLIGIRPGTGNDLATSLVPGSRLQGGRYIIKSVLGQGGMGAALLATDVRLDDKSVVIKELLSDSTDPTRQLEDVRNFKREVATLAHIDHPLVPNVTDHFQEGLRYFMVQEYVDGENLEDHLNRIHQPMPEREVLTCASQMLDVLDYLSQQTPPIVHRDIKPANIIIGSKDKRAHLVDFGIARADEIKNAKRRQTTALGTAGYAPPEQYQGNADPRSDLYALAATLHHLLTDRDPRNFPPFTYPPVRTLNSRLSPDIEQVLIRALMNNPAQRYQSAYAMKQDIDRILHQRFGVSGSIDSYTLGTSGAMGTFNSFAGSQNSAGAFNNPSSFTPVQPLVNPSAQGPSSFAGIPYSTQGNPGTLGTPPSPTRRQRSRLAWLFIPLVVLLLLAVVVYALHLFPDLPKTTTSSGSATGNGIGVTVINNEPIGISDGSSVFDTTIADANLKMQAAQAIKNHNTNAAISDLNQAVALSSNDAEALIYLEDQHVLASSNPYVTIAVATMLTGNASGDVGTGRDDLQGAYIAQKEYNDAAKLQGGVQVRLLIANSGSTTDANTQQLVQKVTQQLVQLSHSDKTFIGVMGWPYSSSTLTALQEQVLAENHIPLVSQTASSDALTAKSPYFFRVVPSNEVQGQEGAVYSRQSLHATRVALFSDPTNSYSQSLATDFKAAFTSGGGTIVAQEHYTVGKPSTIPGALQDALAQHPNLIYFAGYADDVSTLLTNLSNSSIPVMGGDALYELGGYQSSSRTNFGVLHFTAFAYPDEWAVLGYSAMQPAFFSEYTSAFDPQKLHPGAYHYSRPDNDAILSYDATVALLTACNNVLTSGHTTVTPQLEQGGLKSIDTAHAFQGVSGQIAFGANNDPVQKAIVVLYVDSSGHIHMVPKGLNRFLK
jgi:eukaryotic-like serine/threonine-protein kinase